MRSDSERLKDVPEAIERIEKHASRGKDAFRAAHADRVWAEAAGLRNVIVHHYFGVDNEVVWGVVERDLPALKRLVQEIVGQ